MNLTEYTLLYSTKQKIILTKKAREILAELVTADNLPAYLNANNVSTTNAIGVDARYSNVYNKNTTQDMDVARTATGWTYTTNAQHAVDNIVTNYGSIYVE